MKQRVTFFVDTRRKINSSRKIQNNRSSAKKFFSIRLIDSLKTTVTEKCFLFFLSFFLPRAVFQSFFRPFILLFSALFSSFLIPLRSVGRGYTSAEEKPPEETPSGPARDAHNSDNRDFISYKPRL